MKNRYRLEWTDVDGKFKGCQHYDNSLEAEYWGRERQKLLEYELNLIPDKNRRLFTVWEVKKGR